jgi:glycosyltransferase involved in cell wall biosynthesis
MLKEMKDVPYQVLTVPFWPRFTSLNNLTSRLVRRLTPYKTESFSLYYNVLLRSRIKKVIGDMDVISTHYWLDSRLFSNLASKLGVASVFHILGGPYSKEFFEADKSTMYVAVSQNTKDLINGTHKIGIEDVVTPGIPSDILMDIEKVQTQKEAKPSSLLFVGRLQPSKGVFELVEIFKRLVSQNPELKLTIVGEGDVSARLKEKIKESNLEDNILLTGSLPYKEIFKHYRRSTLFVFPSKSEVFPLVSIEAMASGLPVVVSDIPSLRESTGGNAVLLPPDDLDMWVKTLNSLLKDREQREKLSRKGLHWARDFTWEKKAKEYEMALQKTLAIFKSGSG